MPRYKIKDLEQASGGSKYIGVTDAGSEQAYTLLNIGDFTTVPGTDIQSNPMSYADTAAGNAPAVTATPPAPTPTNPANNATLSREYVDIVRVWTRTAGVWAWAYDIDRRKSTFCTMNLVDPPTLINTYAPGSFGDSFLIVPRMLDGQHLNIMKIAAFSGAGNTGVSMFKNGVGVACYTATATNTAVTTTVCPLEIVNVDDIISFQIASAFSGTQKGLSITLEFSFNS